MISYIFELPIKSSSGNILLRIHPKLSILRTLVCQPNTFYNAMSSASLPPSTKSNFGHFVEMIRTTPRRPPPDTSLAGQVAIITGGNGAIGLGAARVFLQLGLSHIILAVRTIKKGEDAAAPLRQAHQKAKVEVWPLDMLSYESIQAFAKKTSDLQRLDVVILNAAISKLNFSSNPSTGHEEALQVNYLSTALLAILLLPVLKIKSPQDRPGRLSIVSSGLALHSQFTNRDAVPLIPSFDDSSSWNGLSAASERYAVTKTMEMMLALKLSQYFAAGDVVVNAVDPGFTAGSGLHRDIALPLRLFLKVFSSFIARSPEQAAWTYVDAIAVKGSESHGSFIMNWEIYP